MSGRSYISDLDFSSAPNANAATSFNGIILIETEIEELFLLLNGAVQVNKSLVAVFCLLVPLTCTREKQLHAKQEISFT